MSALSALYFHDTATALAELKVVPWPNDLVYQRLGDIDGIKTVRPARMSIRRFNLASTSSRSWSAPYFDSSHDMASVNP